MNIVIVGHVDHGKSTIIGRLLTDTGSLPEGKLNQVKEFCKHNSRPFEYAFLLDALKDEQKQGITIDSARCFFSTRARDYIIIDAPGHVEFLKNMVSGAARAEAALLVIDAKEGIKENSRRHAFLLSMLGISQVVVCVNKMDLVCFSKETFEKIKSEYSHFLNEINIKPLEFIPVSGLMGDNISDSSKNLQWFNGNTVLSTLDSFKKEDTLEDKPFRMPLQDIYKFTAKGDDRRIVAGRIESGKIAVGDEVIFLPSNKHSKIESIEEFNSPQKNEAFAGNSVGFTLSEQIYVRRGELMCKVGEKLPNVSTLLKCNIFWMGKNPLLKNKDYMFKIGTEKSVVTVKDILNILDVSDLSKSSKSEVSRHDVAEVIFELPKQISFDLFSDFASTGRFVIVDGYDVVGGGIIIESLDDSRSEFRRSVYLRETKWEKSMIGRKERAKMYAQNPKFCLITGKSGIDKKSIAKNLEKSLFFSGRKVYFLGIGNILRGLDSDIDKKQRFEHIRRFGEVSNLLVDAGLVVFATASDLVQEEIKLLKTLVGDDSFLSVNLGKNLAPDFMFDLIFEENESVESILIKISDLLKNKKVIFDI